MIAEIPYMIVWGYFSAMGWMSANWTVEKVVPDKSQTYHLYIVIFEKNFFMTFKKVTENMNHVYGFQLKVSVDKHLE